MSEAVNLLHVVYPTEGHKTFELSTFIMGQVLTDPKQSKLAIQNKPVALTQHGYFNAYVDLKPGQNAILINLKHPNQTFQKTHHIISELPEPVISTLDVDSYALTPNSILALMPGDTTVIGFRCHPDVNVSLSIPGVLSTLLPVSPKYPEAKTEKDGYIDNREFVFKELHQTRRKIPRAGWFEATISISSDATAYHDQPIILNLELNGQRKIITLPISLSIWPSPKQATVQTDNADGAIIRTEPPEGNRLTPLHSGALLWVDQQIDNWLRIRLSPQDTAWIHKNDTNWQNVGLGQLGNSSKTAVIEPPYVILHDITANDGSIVLNTNKILPLHIDASAKQIEASIYGATMNHVLNSNDTAKSPLFENVQATQERENVISLSTALNKRCAGFDYRYNPNGNIEILIKPLPEKLSDLRIVIDPGHGGVETGSMGLSKLPEKSLNLTLAKLFKTSLEKEGIQNVTLSRSSDIDLSLPARGVFVRQQQPHLSISIHHNALPDGRDPAKYKGACCFYYHPFSKPLAESLQNALVTNAKKPDFGVFHESFYMTRIPQAISVLVELGFFTNPDEYERLIDPNHQQQSVDALTQGVLDFFNSQS